MARPPSQVDKPHSCPLIGGGSLPHMSGPKPPSDTRELSEARLGLAGLGVVRLGVAWFGVVSLGQARGGAARLGKAWHGSARRGEVGRGKARRGVVWRGSFVSAGRRGNPCRHMSGLSSHPSDTRETSEARRGAAWRGKAGLGEARPGGARLGEARLGMAWHGMAWFVPLVGGGIPADI
jgi:hypothetical protein